MKKIKEIIVPAVALFLICLVATFLLGSTDNLTKDKIADVQKKAASEARLKVCPEAVDFSEKSVMVGGVEYIVYEGVDKENNTVGYAVTTEAKSYGGKIQIMTGFDADLKVTGVEVLSIEDTPGLGMNAKKESFRSQFIGKAGRLTVTKNAPGDSEIQALTGATISSNAVTGCVNKAYDAVKSLGGEN